MNPETFKKFMANFVTGITIVTTKLGNEDYGITINSFNSVSLNPPMILYSISKQTERFEIFNDAKEFVVNILDEKSKFVSEAFASNNKSNWKDLFTDNLKVQGSICSIHCKTYYRYEGGDHKIIVGLVEDLHQNSDNKPLVYYKSAYCNVKI